MIRRAYQSEELTIYHGNAEDWPGEERVDLVLTNPYGPLPASLYGAPMIVHQWDYNRVLLQRWIGGAELELISLWNNGREAFWAANMPPLQLDLTGFRPEPGGWYPLEVPVRLLQAWWERDADRSRKATIWDGFMGRGTVAKAALSMRQHYVGVEQLGVHIEIAAKYLGLEGPVYVAP